MRKGGSIASAAERFVRRLYKASEGRPGFWCSIVGLDASEEVAAEAQRQGWIETIGGHSVRLTEQGRQKVKR